MKSIHSAALCSLLMCTASLHPQLASAQQTEALKNSAALPELRANGGLRFDSQGAGTPNTLSGYGFLPIYKGSQGDVLFAEAYLNWNIGSDGLDSTVGSSTRLGYRWLNPDKNWLYGFNAGIDNRPFQGQNTLQAGVGLEALSKNVELRLNGYIPFGETSTLYSTGYNGAYGLVNDQLQLNRSRWFGVALGGIDAELGTPVARWNGGDLRIYAAYYYLDGAYVNGSSGVRARAEARVGSNLSVGATLSYDDIFKTQATGYVRLGLNPQANNVSATVNEAEQRFLAQRGLPVERQRVIQIANTNVRDQEAARDPLTGKQWVVRCVGLNPTAYTVRCGYADLSTAVNAIGAPADVMLLANGSSSNLNGATLRLPAGTSLSNGSNAPILATQAGFIPLMQVFGPGAGAQPQVNNGILSIGSNTTIAGLGFNNTSITNYSTKHVRILNNNFIGSYTDNPTPLATAEAYGNINVSANALPAIQLNGVEDLLIANNSFSYPQVQTYLSQYTNGNYVCNQNNNNPSGLCISANAIRLNNVTDAIIANNTVVGALDEAFRINNPSGNLLIANNNIAKMRMGPDSNIGTAIIIGQNQGTSNVQIINNTISDNSRGVYSIISSANQSGIAVDNNPKNVIDPIEIGLCRGTVSYPRYQDLYAAADFSGNCSGPVQMNLTVSGNTINLPAITGARQDGDGIDFNIGANAILRANVESNRIITLGGSPSNIGDNGITIDLRGNSDNIINIFNNFIDNVGDSAIGFSLQNTALGLAAGNSVINISGNTFGAGVPPNKNVEAERIINTGNPVSTFNVNGTGDNALTPGNVANKAYGNTGDYPNLYLNGVIYTP